MWLQLIVRLEAAKYKSAVAAASDLLEVNNNCWSDAVVAAATAADTSLNLPNLPDSDRELTETTAVACYLYWDVRQIRFIAAAIASFIVATFAKPSGFLNAWVFLH